MNDLTVGSVVYATEQGLGRLAKSFYDAGVINQVLIMRHPSHPTHEDWYPGARSVPIRSVDWKPLESFVHTVDLMLFFENPFYWPILDYCALHSIPTALMTMYECFPRSPTFLPNVFICPSKLDEQAFTTLYPKVPSIYLPVPVQVPWRQRTRAEVFVHNAGHGSFRDRNGTEKLLEAFEYVQSPAKFIIRTQEDLYRRLSYRHQSMLTNPLTRRGQVFNYDDPDAPVLEKMFELRTGTVSYETLWDEGDAFIFPESFNGLSLPLQEARAAGMYVIATNRFPMNTWLPVEGLIRPTGYRKAAISGAYMQFDEAIIEPKDIAAKIDETYGKDITQYSRDGLNWGSTMSWANVKPLYNVTLQAIYNQYDRR
jgi:glycosyltransferase involved in cell wall biosynthesis